MPRLTEGLARWFGRVELLALGAEDDRREAEAALARSDAMAARAHARALLARVPGSPIGLALWADAAELAGLDHEAVDALEPLAEVLPWRADVWLRLAHAYRSLRADTALVRETLEKAAFAPESPEGARAALIDLCDLDWAAGDAARAGRWLDRIPATLSGPDVALRRAEHALARRDLGAARTALDGSPDPPTTDGRAALARGRLAAALGEPAAVDALLRAYVLEAPAASRALADAVASTRDAVVVRRVRAVVEAAGALAEPMWAAAFALAEGRGDDARRALRKAVAEGDRDAAEELYSLALRDRDPRALADAISARTSTGQAPPEDALAILDAHEALDRGDARRAFDRIEDVVGDDSAAWKQELRDAAARALAPAGAEAAWPSLLVELRHLARAVDRIDLVPSIEALAVERERPLRVAVVGEFNAGKSTFLNALLGADVAPTGVLPTTATVHWVSWAPDPFARISVAGAADRVVPHAELKRALSELSRAGTRPERVFIYAPLERLKRIEILDTPGFNAPDAAHIAAARAAFEEAHVAIWLLDAAQPLKESERAVLAEIRALGVPVQILVNKADRLAADELATAMAHVAEGLEQAGLASQAPPIALSAKLALAGKLGDDGALARSRWAEVEATLAASIVDRSAVLRERALRRRAVCVLGAIATEADRRGAEERGRVAERASLAIALAAAATRLETRAEEAAGAVAVALREPRARLADDLRPFSLAPEQAPVDAPAGARRYATDRAVFRLSPALCAACLADAGLAPQAAPPTLAAILDALVLGAASAKERAVDVAALDAARLAAAAVDATARALRAAADLPPLPRPAQDLGARARSLAGALAVG